MRNSQKDNKKIKKIKECNTEQTNDVYARKTVWYAEQTNNAIKYTRKTVWYAKQIMKAKLKMISL